MKVRKVAYLGLHSNLIGDNTGVEEIDPEHMIFEWENVNTTYVTTLKLQIVSSYENDNGDDIP